MTEPATAARIERRTVIVGGVALAVVVGVVAAAALLLGRGGSGDAGGVPLATSTTVAPTPDQTPAGGPVIVAFDVPRAIRCNLATVIPASWSTRGAVGVRVEIDGPGGYGFYPPSGAAQLPFPCDDSSHRYRLVAIGPTGVSSARSVEVRELP